MLETRNTTTAEQQPKQQQQQQQRQQKLKSNSKERNSQDTLKSMNFTPLSTFGGDDQEKDNPNIVDDLLSKELLGLSVKARNDFQEEIHGVRCLAPEETPQLLKQSLIRLERELNHEVPIHRKKAYIQSQKLSAANSNTTTSNTYINTEEFRLRFLRCELFDVPKAAIRMTKFLDLILELFGEYALKRPIRLSDFSNAELRKFRKGRFQFLPYRARGGICGRRVLCIFPDEEWESIAPYLRNKIFLYMVWTAGNDVDTQKEGIVFVCWFDSTFTVTKSPAVKTKDHETVSVRGVAVHVCSPDTPVYRFRRSIVTMRLGRLRFRLRQHIGE